MEDKALKNIINIKLDEEPFTCFVLADNSKYITARIRKFFTSAATDLEPVEIEDRQKNTTIKTFPLETVISNLKPRFLKELAMEGLSGRIDKAIDERDNPKEIVLSEFDRMMLKAINYKPQ